MPVLDQASTVPPFRQIQDAVVAAIASGALAPGARLPTVRGLASTLDVATNTVASAYRALEESGVVEGRGRAGTFVRLGDDPIEAGARALMLESVAALRGLGVDHAHAARLLAEAYGV